MSENTKTLSEAGVSIWLDDLSRERIETGNLADLVKESYVVGVTTNPSIFAAALADGERYDAQVRELAAKAGADVDDTVFQLTTSDVRDACDVLKPVFDATGGVDGRVSIEVAPDLAHDTEGTIASAQELWKTVDRANLLIKIPGHRGRYAAITETLGEGISVNVTLIFGLDATGQVMEAYVAGLEQAKARPRPVHDPLGRVVLRLPRRHRDRQAPRDLGAEASARARPAWPTPAWPTRPTRSSSPVTAGRRSPRPAPTSSARCGPRPG